MLKHRLLMAEFLVFLASVVGWVIALRTGQLLYAAVPVTIALLLNLLNRLRLEEQMKRRLTVTINQLERQLKQENYTVHEQQLEKAIASLKAQIPEYLAQIESSELDSSALKIIQFKGRLTGLEESLNSIVQYLNSASLPSRVERLEEVIASTTAELHWMERQLTDTTHSRSDQLQQPLPTLQPEGVPVVNKSQPFTSDPTHTIPVESPTLAPFQESIPVEEPPDFLLPPPTWSFLHTLTGHSDWVHALAITPDGQTLVSGSFDKTIKVWHLPTGELLHTLAKHAKGVLCLAISPDGKILASGSFDEKIHLWSLDTGELMGTLEGHTSSVRSLAISENGQMLISGSFDETIKLWRLDKGDCLGNLSQWTGQVSAIALSSDGQTLASAGGAGVIGLRLLDTTDGEIKPSPAIALTGNLSSVCSLAITPDGEILAAGCTDGNIKLWKLETLELLGIFEAHTGPVMSVVFSVDTPTLISASADGTVMIWHVKTGQQLGILRDDSAASVMAVAISSDGHWIASGGADSMIKIWQRD
jgi:WD40 repeat protein